MMSQSSIHYDIKHHHISFLLYNKEGLLMLHQIYDIYKLHYKYMELVYVLIADNL